MTMDSSTEKHYALDDLMPLIREQLAAGRSVKFSPRGTSMLPMLRQGRDTVTLSPLPDTLHKYDLPLYQRDNGQYVLHRIVDANETFTCVGDNQFVLEPGIRRDQMIAVVTAFTRDQEEHQVLEFSHRLYCRLWHYSRPVRRVLLALKSKLRRLLK